MKHIIVETKVIQNIFSNFDFKLPSKFSKIISSGSGALWNIIFLFELFKESLLVSQEQQQEKQQQK